MTWSDTTRMPPDQGTRASGDGRLKIGRLLSPIRSLFIEVFAGSCKLSIAVSQYAQVVVSSWDVIYGPEFDLLRKPSVHKLLRVLESPYVVAVWWGTPCSSMTRARRLGRPGPVPLRSDEWPEGLPALSSSNQRKVDDGNRFAVITAIGLELGRTSGSFGVCENPWKSFLWAQPRLCTATARLGLEDFVFDFCQFGEPWQKRTRLRGDLPGLDELVRL